MRKWMRDRLKRRKKTAEEPTAEPKPAPLQPAYFESKVESAPAAPVAEEVPEAPENDSQDDQAPSAAPQPTSADPNRRRRRRRGRGGRGRDLATGGTPPPPVPEPPAPPAPAALPVSSPKTPRGVVILAIGLPGSGKSSWFKRHKITPLSSDLLRSLLFDDATEQRFQDLVFSNLRSMLKARLIARRPVNYVDATNLTPHERHSWIKLAKDYQYEVQAVYFDVPVEVCLERNQKRQRVVSEDVMRRMAAKLKPPTFDEGFSKVTVVRVKKKDGSPAENAIAE